jgi:integrase
MSSTSIPRSPDSGCGSGGPVRGGDYHMGPAAQEGQGNPWPLSRDRPPARADWAIKLHAKIALGHDPGAARLEDKQQRAETFEATLRLYFAGKSLRPRSRVEIERHLLKNAAQLHRRPLAQITKREIANCLATVTDRSGPIQANRTRASLSAFFMWCCRRGLVDNNPVDFTERHKEESRHRVLSDPELRQLWSALPETDYGKAAKLLILTGQRRDEIGKLRWSEIDIARRVISLPRERTKNGKPHDVPLSGPALAILESQPRFGEYVFGRCGIKDWSHKKAELDAKLQLEHWVVHDLRRTAATRMVDLGILPHAVEAVLNHYGHRSGVAGVYNRSLYAAEKAQALARWAEHVMSLVEDRPADIVPIGRGVA